MGLVIVFIPFVSSVITVSTLVLSGVEISLFHILGLYLVVGLGLDYGIFIFRDNQRGDDGCFTAVLLSAITSIMAFGILSQSSTPMISSFGTVIFLGIIFNLMFVPGIRNFRRN